MIASLKGKLESIGINRAVIDVGGVGYQVYMPTSTLSQLGSTGSEVKLRTHFHLRDDGATLYGFATTPELELFQMLIDISGLGPKLALAMLSAMEVEHLANAIATGNADLLTQIPGIGKKMASRLVLELKDKIAAGWVATPITELTQESNDVAAALTALGYSAVEASRAVANLPAKAAQEPLEEKVRLALAYFGGE